MIKKQESADAVSWLNFQAEIQKNGRKKVLRRIFGEISERLSQGSTVPHALRRRLAMLIRYNTQHQKRGN